MIKRSETLLAVVLVLFGSAISGRAANAPLKPETLTKNLSKKYAAVKQYDFESNLVVTRRTGENNQRQVLANAKVKLAAMPGGKYRVQIVNADKSEYLMVSDGQQAWTYAPALNQYCQQKAAAPADGSLDDLLEGYASGNDPTVALQSATFVVPSLVGLAKAAQSSFLTKGLLTVLSKKDEQSRQTMAELSVNPTTLTISGMIWMRNASIKGQQVILRIESTFTNFHVGAPVAASNFTFTPPDQAKQVEALATPGQAN